MNKIKDIITDINDVIKSHSVKDIQFNGVCELITKKEVTQPCKYIGGGEYEPVINDTSGLIVYHRILSFENDEDLEGGFGRNSLTTENYSMLMVVYGNMNVVKQSIEDENYNLSMEFKKLIPRKTTLTDIHRISVISVDNNKQDLSEQEGLNLMPENILFGIEYNVAIRTTENCNILECNG